jgi:Xaa-Pro aminopeptidase
LVSIISEPKYVQKKAGFNFQEKLLQAAQCHDRRPPLPLLLTLENGKEYLLVREIEKGNMLQVNCRLPVLHYHPYFLLEDKWREMVPKDLPAVIKTKSDAAKITVDSGFVFASYEQLSGEFQVELANGAVSPFVQGEVYRATRQEVNSLFYQKQAQVEQAAQKIARKHKHGDQLASLLGQGGEDLRFPTLDAAMVKEGLDSVIASSPLAVMELAGYPAGGLGAPELLAIYNQGEDEVTILTADAKAGQLLQQLGFHGAGRMELAQLVKGKVVGFEEDSLDVATYLLLAANCRLQKASELFRRWRESKLNAKDLSYFVITGAASCYAIENTLAYACECVRQEKDLTEMELYRHYQQLVQQFSAENQIPVSLEIYFTNLHAGSRSPYPAGPADFPVNKEGKTYKMDAGLMVYDGPGLIHASSDMARTICFTPEGQEIYSIMAKCIREGTIPHIAAGQTAKEIYWYGINQLAQYQSEAERLGMLPEGFVLAEDYQRDIGHLMERQEAFTALFRRDREQVVREYMIGCIEYQWPYKGHGIAYEDMFVVTPNGAVNLTDY